MTTVYQIIVDAYRQSNLVALGNNLTQLQETEALRYLNRIVKSVFGNEAGDPLTAFSVEEDVLESEEKIIPQNTRLMLNLKESLELHLHPNPSNGSRFALIDVSKNLSTYPIVIKGNGQLIEGASSLTINTNGYNAEWFYREDLATWTKYAPLDLFESFPFPEEFDDYFIILLAFRLNPAYERQLDPQSATMLERSKSQLRARYSQEIPMNSELGLIRLSKVSADRDVWITGNWSVDSFNKGFPW